MGGGTYSFTDRTIRAKSSGYYTKSSRETFSQRGVHNDMSPNGVTIRESRDSKEHPESVPIIIALDLTGSMGSVPAHLVKDGLPNIMKKIMDSGIKHPQILFLGIGDHECDNAPLQVGQFESNDELLDKWLTNTYLEGGGGGNEGESYLLAWYFAKFHTDIDSWNKRGQKGFLFTIGDEPTLQSVPGKILKELMGSGQHPDNYSAAALLESAQEKYHVFHINISETWQGTSDATKNCWSSLMPKTFINAQDHMEVSTIISNTVNRLVNQSTTMHSDSNINQSSIDSAADTNTSIDETLDNIIL